MGFELNEFLSRFYGGCHCHILMVNLLKRLVWLTRNLYINSVDFGLYFEVITVKVVEVERSRLENLNSSQSR